MTFASPWAFWALIIIPLLVLHRFRRQRNRQGLAFSDLNEAARAGRSLRQRFIQLPFALRLLALALLITGLARPQQGIEKIEQISHGIAIEIVVDRSSSMAETFVYQGRKMNRLEAVKLAFHDFVSGNGRELTGRPNDLIGMVAFARFAETVCPLTLAHGAVAGFVKQVQLVSREERHEDGTAIGDGLALAAARLKAADDEAQNKDDYEIKSKIIILLTDGVHNVGQNTPMQAAALAKEWGIKIYTIGIGEAKKRSFFSLSQGPDVDVKTLTALARETGGQFWLAEDGRALLEIYETIDRLEKSEIESIRYMDYKEHFSRFVITGLALMALAVSLEWSILAVRP